jgi:hypothetical protein
MDRPKLDAAVNVKSDDVFFPVPVLTVPLSWDRQAGFSILAFRTFPFPSICAVAAVDVQASAAFQNPSTRVVVVAWHTRNPQALLVVGIEVARFLHPRNLTRGT